MPTLPVRAAAYTRTSILRRFLDQLALGVPARVDSAYAEARLGLKGGDIRAFLQSARVLGLVDPYGAVTDRARRTRGLTQRPEAIREGLQEAYPELLARWETQGGMQRTQVEDFFKIEYGLSASSAAPAAKLLLDLMREYGPPLQPYPEGERSGSLGSTRHPAGDNGPTETESRGGTGPTDLRLEMLDRLMGSIKVDINDRWDADALNLFFDRMERLVDKVSQASPGGPATGWPVGFDGAE